MKGARAFGFVLMGAYVMALPAGVVAQAPPARPAMAAADKDTLKRGETLFYQRCSLCHLGRIIKDDTFQPIGPSLSGVLKDATPDREADIRQFIQMGTLRMPGWKYAFSPTEFDDLIAYIKTL
jgi:mono/diheme cytochrome c family protein